MKKLNEKQIEKIRKVYRNSTRGAILFILGCAIFHELLRRARQNAKPRDKRVDVPRNAGHVFLERAKNGARHRPVLRRRRGGGQALGERIG